MDFKTLKFLVGFHWGAGPALWFSFLGASWTAWAAAGSIPVLTAWFVGSLAAPGTPQKLPLICLAGAIVLEFVLGRLADVLSTYSLERVRSFAFRDACRSLIARPVRFFEDELSGSLASNVRETVGALRQLDAHVSHGAPSVLVALAVSGVTLWYLSPWGLPLYVAWIATAFFVIVLFDRWLTPYRNRRFATESRLTGMMADTFGGSASVIGMGVRQAELRTITDLSDAAAKARKASGIRYDVTYGTLNLVNQLVLLSCFVLLFWRASNGEPMITQATLLIGSLKMFSDVTFGFRTLILDLGDTLSDARSLRELLENLSAPEPSGLPEISVPRGALEFKNLSFGYVPGRRIFDGLDLSVKPGERVALVGPSGAGKSTLLKLALRLYVPDAGSVLVDGSDVAKFDPDSLRRQVALVPQEPALFHRSVFENVALAREGATREMVEKALRAAHAWEVVERLPQGMDSVVGERGVKLSGGERQRVALARAFVRDARIVLLDEPTSALDSASERAIQSAMGELLKGRTSLTIAHRLSTVMHADRIVVLERGRIVGQGTHAELLAQGGLYAKLWDLQAGGMLGDTRAA